MAHLHVSQREMFGLNYVNIVENLIKVKTLKRSMSRCTFFLLQIVMESSSDSLGILDSIEICSEGEEGSNMNVKESKLHELPAFQLKCLYPFQ